MRSTPVDESANYDGTYVSSFTQLSAPAVGEGYSVEFTGSGYAEVPHDPQLNPSGDYSIEMHLRWSGTARGAAFSKRSSTRGPMLLTNSDGSYTRVGQVALRQYGSSSKIASNRDDLNDDAWHHIVAIRRGSQLELWIDGVLDNAVATGGVSFSSVTGKLKIGKDIYSFAGGVDEVAFYDYALSKADIRQHAIQAPYVTQANPAPGDEWLYAMGRDGDNERSSVLLVSCPAARTNPADPSRRRCTTPRQTAW